MAELELYEHRRCAGIYTDPDVDGIEALKPETNLTLRRASDLLGIPAGDLEELLDSGALKSTTDGNGRTVVRASDLQAFTGACRPVTFAEVDDDQEADERDEEAAPGAIPASARRANPADGDGDGDGWVKLRLNDLRRLLRGDGQADAGGDTPSAA